MTTLEDLPAHKLVEELRHRRIDARSARYPPHRCEDCTAVAPHYMVKNEVWALAWPDYKQESGKRRREWRAHGTGPLFCLLCFTCLEKRLDRKLTIDDFDLEIPINFGIALGVDLFSTQIPDLAARHLAKMTADERVEFFHQIANGYCVKCGGQTDDTICHCENDD